MHPKLSIVYYTDGHAPKEVRHECVNNIMRCHPSPHQTIAVASGPKTEIYREDEFTVAARIEDRWGARTYERMYTQMLAGVEIATGNVIAFAEHDVFYPPTYWDFMARMSQAVRAKACYNRNWYWVNKSGAFKPPYTFPANSQCACSREFALHYLKKKILEAQSDHVGVAELTAGAPCDSFFVVSSKPCLDIRHGQNVTGTRLASKPSDYTTKVPHWEHLIPSIMEDLKSNDMAVGSPT